MAQPGKILVLVSSLGGGGAERVATHLCNAWSSAGHDVTLMTTFAGDTSTGYLLDAEVRQLALRPDSAGSRKNPWHQLRRLSALRSTIRSNSPDFVVTFLTNVNVAGIIAALGLGVRTIVCERIYPPLFPLSATLNTLRRLTYPLAYRVVVQTDATQRWFAAALPRAHTSVIPNPLVIPMAESPPTLPPNDVIAEGAKLLLAAGRLDAQKGFIDLVDAFASLADAAAQWHLVILGEGPQRQTLANKIAEMGLTHCIHLPGWAGNIGHWYRRADLFVLSSHFEGFPNALLEAMGHGLPCIAYDCPAGPSDMIDDGRSGRLVALTSGVTGLADAMAQLMRDESSRTAMAEQALTAVARYADEHVLGQWSELMDAPP